MLIHHQSTQRPGGTSKALTIIRMTRCVHKDWVDVGLINKHRRTICSLFLSHTRHHLESWWWVKNQSTVSLTTVKCSNRTPFDSLTTVPLLTISHGSDLKRHFDLVFTHFRAPPGLKSLGCSLPPLHIWNSRAFLVTISFVQSGSQRVVNRQKTVIRSNTYENRWSRETIMRPWIWLTSRAVLISIDQ